MLLLYPGSFDPLHRGHLDIIHRAHRLGADLVIGIGHNPAKQGLLPIDQRLALARAELTDLARVQVETYAGSTLAFARSLGAQGLLRGIRTGSDLEFESSMAAIHRTHGMETVFLLSEGRLGHVSGNSVRMALAAGLSLNDLVPPGVARVLERRSPP